MSEPVIGAEDAVDKHQKRVLAQLLQLGVEPATVGVYGVTGQPMRTVIILHTQTDIDKVAALGQPWKLKLSRWAAA